MVLAAHLMRDLIKVQKQEKTHYEIYNKLSLSIPDENNKKILSNVAQSEMKHYNFWKTLTKKDVSAQPVKVYFYILMAKILGLSFALKLMEKGQILEDILFEKLKDIKPDVASIINDEKKMEKRLLNLIDEERLKYTGSMVLGLNDAIVELTGALAGFTLALRHTKTIAMAGVIMGISASLSMAASEYLKTKEENDSKSPIKASAYTGTAYICVVTFLITPYFIFKNPYVCLATSFACAITVIIAFNYYVAVAKNLPFKKRFLEMLYISIGVAILNFFVGLMARKYLGLDAA